MRQFCTEAIGLKPHFADAFFNRGNARRKKGDEEGALDDLAEAARLEYSPKPDTKRSHKSKPPWSRYMTCAAVTPWSATCVVERDRL